MQIRVFLLILLGFSLVFSASTETLQKDGKNLYDIDRDGENEIFWYKYTPITSSNFSFGRSVFVKINEKANVDINLKNIDNSTKQDALYLFDSQSLSAIKEKLQHYKDNFFLINSNCLFGLNSIDSLCVSADTCTSFCQSNQYKVYLKQGDSFAFLFADFNLHMKQNYQQVDDLIQLIDSFESREAGKIISPDKTLLILDYSDYSNLINKMSNLNKQYSEISNHEIPRFFKICKTPDYSRYKIDLPYPTQFDNMNIFPLPKPADVVYYQESDEILSVDYLVYYEVKPDSYTNLLGSIYTIQIIDNLPTFFNSNNTKLVLGSNMQVAHQANQTTYGKISFSLTNIDYAEPSQTPPSIPFIYLIRTSNEQIIRNRDTIQTPLIGVPTSSISVSHSEKQGFEQETKKATGFLYKFLNPIYAPIYRSTKNPVLSVSIIVFILIFLIKVFINIFLLITAYIQKPKTAKLLPEIRQAFGSGFKNGFLFFNASFLLLALSIVISIFVYKPSTDIPFFSFDSLVSEITGGIPQLLSITLAAVSSALLILYLENVVKKRFYGKYYYLPDYKIKEIKNTQLFDKLIGLEEKIRDLKMKFGELNLPIDPKINEITENPLENKKRRLSQMSVDELNKFLTNLVPLYEEVYEQAKSKLEFIEENSAEWEKSIIKNLEKKNYVTENMILNIPDKWRKWAMQRQVSKDPSSFLVYRNGKIKRLKIETIGEDYEFFVSVMQDTIKKLDIKGILVTSTSNHKPILTLLPSFIKKILFINLVREAKELLDNMATNNFFSTFEKQITYSNENILVKTTVSNFNIYLIFSNQIPKEKMYKSIEEICSIISRIS